MKTCLKRIAALLLCLCLLAPCAALAEEDYTGRRFYIEAQMDASAYPAGQQAMLSGIADLVNQLSFEGELDRSFDGSFDLTGDLLLEHAEETRTPMHLYGTAAYWGLQSPLLNDQTLMFNMDALLEFAMKIYFHMDIPLQRIALFLTPYAHNIAFAAMVTEWQTVFGTADDARTIPKDDVMTLAQQLADIASTDRGFLYWVKAVALESGYDEVIMNAMETLPEWIEGFVDEDGIAITVNGPTETWRAGDVTLFTRTIAENKRDTWALTLPPTLSGYQLSASCSGDESGASFTFSLRVDSEDEGTVLDAHITADSLPLSLLITAPFSLSVDLLGAAVGDEGIHARFEGDGSDGAFTLRQLSPETSAPMLTLTGSLEECQPNIKPAYSQSNVQGVTVFSLNDTTLAELLSHVKESMISGLLPLLRHVPASSFQSVMDLLEDSGVLSAIAAGALSGDDAISDEEDGWVEEESWSEDEEDFAEEEEYEVEAEE